MPSLGEICKERMGAKEMTAPAKNIVESIEFHQEQLTLRRFIKSKLPSATVSFMEDGTSQFMDDGVLPQATGIHFYLSKDGRLFMRPFIELKRRGKNSIRVFSPQSYICNKLCVADMLNDYASNKSIVLFPDSVQLLVGETYKQEADAVVDRSIGK